MANTKVTNHVIANNAITADQVSSAAITAAKLHSTLDLSSKTLTLPSAAVATTQSQSDGSTKIATTAYVDTAITNLIDSAPGTMNTLNEIAAALNDDANFNTTVTNSIAAKLPLAGGTMTGDLILGDNVKLELGAASGGDLQIYHDGSNSYIKDDGTGNLFIQGGPAVVIEDTSGNNMAYFGDGGEVILYHNHAAKFETTAYGASTSGTGAFKLPVGTTGQRPTAATGQLRFNSTDGRIEVYNGSEWSAVGATGTGNHSLDTFTGDGSTTAFSLSLSPANEDALSVFINGAYQEKGDYSLSGNTLTLDTAPLSGEKISVHTIHGAVHDGTTALNQQFTGDGSTTAFTLNADPGSENNTQIYINGVYQQKTDYTVSGTTLTFDTAPTNGDIIEVNSFTVTNLGSSDQVTEGVSNLYHTSARAISAISAGNLTGLTVDTNTLSVDATNNRVGVGTTSPLGPLHVVGDANATGISHTYVYDGTSLVVEAGEPSIQLRAADSGTHGGSLLWRYGDNVFSAIANPTDDTIDWVYGVTNANSFDVHGGTNLSSYKKIMTIGAGGNVGIGTSTPTFGKLQVHGSKYVVTNSGKALGGIHVSPDTGAALNEYGGAISFSAGGNGSGAIAAVNTTGSDNDSMGLAFFTHSSSTGSADAAEVMRIDANGEVLIGATGSGAAGGLYVNSSATNANVGAARFQTSDINGSSDIGCTAMCVVKTVNNNTTSNVFVRFGINGYAGGSGQINANGSSQAAFGTFSDRRLKENITDLPSQLDKIKAMRPVEFDYIESEHTVAGEHQLGFIAQEIEEIYPDLVGEDTEGMKTLSGLGKWEARLIKAIQEQQTIIEDLKARIETLEE